MRAILFTVALLAASPAWALDLTCTVPDAAITTSRLGELCGDLRQRLRVRADAWSNDQCATEFLRIGVRTGLAQKTRRESQSTVDDDVRSALSTLDSTFPPAQQATCGDGVLDDGSAPGNLDLGETCDDGNTTPGDGCDAECQIE